MCVHMCVWYVGTYGLFPNLEAPCVRQECSSCIEIISLLLLQWKRNDTSNKTENPRNKMLNPGMIFANATWAQRAIHFTAFLGVLSSCPVCLRCSFILCTNKILLWAFPVLTFHSAFCVHVCVLNWDIFLFCYLHIKEGFLSSSSPNQAPLL